MKTQFVSFAVAEDKIEKLVREKNPDAAIPARTKVCRLLEKSLQKPAFEILFNTINESQLSQEHKKQYYDSFDLDFSERGIEIKFAAKTPLIEALEEGSSPRTVDEDLLRSNYKVSKEGFHYKVIPIKTDSPVALGTEHFEQKVIYADQFEKGQYLRELVATVNGKDMNIPFDVAEERGDNVFYRSEAFRTRVNGKIRRQRVYLNSDKSKTVSNISRFVAFRTISNKPSAHRWNQHPGFPGLDLVQDLARQYTALIENEIESILLTLSKVGKKK